MSPLPGQEPARRARPKGELVDGNLPPVFTAALLAQLLGVTLHSANEACRRGEIPASKEFGRWVIRRDAYLGHLERRERANRAPRPEETDVARMLRRLPPPRPRGRANAKPPPSPPVTG